VPLRVPVGEASGRIRLLIALIAFHQGSWPVVRVNNV
jgi:hypothetical protein